MVPKWTTMVRPHRLWTSLAARIRPTHGSNRGQLMGKPTHSLILPVLKAQLFKKSMLWRSTGLRRGPRRDSTAEGIYESTFHRRDRLWRYFRFADYVAVRSAVFYGFTWPSSMIVNSVGGGIAARFDKTGSEK